MVGVQRKDCVYAYVRYNRERERWQTWSESISPKVEGSIISFLGGVVVLRIDDPTCPTPLVMVTTLNLGTIVLFSTRIMKIIVCIFSFSKFKYYLWDQK